MAAPTPPTITGGRWRGRRLAVARGLTTRPTRSLVRQALFNMLGPSIVDARVLDLYSGSGALGLEALSRGARQVVFVERHPQALVALRANLKACAPTPDEASLLPVDVLSLGSVPLAEIDLVTADPPFDLRHALPALLADEVLLPPGVRLAYHGPSDRGPPAALPGRWVLDRTRSYGRSSWHLFSRPAPS